jgi:LysR family transcriptional regulator, nod-box dependent transcriptional activator
MRLAGLDLNLLVALEVLLTERSVSVAADKVHLSQSAMSGALARLRDYFNDELLVNVGGRMQPTQIGESLVEPVRNALELIRSTITERGQFHPEQSDRRFNVVMSDYAAEVLLPAVLQEFSRTATSVGLNIIQPTYDSVVRLERGEIDLLITVEDHLSASHPHELLFEDDFVVLVSQDHPWIGDSLTEEQYLRAHHVVASFGHRLTHEQVHMGDAQGRRHVTAVCPSFNLVPLLVAGSERIATLHRRHAEIYARMASLRMLPLPEPIPPIQEHIQWHAMRRGDAGLLWLRDLFLACARS